MTISDVFTIIGMIAILIGGFTFMMIVSAILQEFKRKILRRIK